MPTKAETLEQDRKVAALTAQGRSAREIAGELDIDIRTVHASRARIRADLPDFTRSFLLSQYWHLMRDASTTKDRVLVLDRVASLAADVPEDKKLTVIDEILEALRSTDASDSTA